MKLLDFQHSGERKYLPIHELTYIINSFDAAIIKVALFCIHD